MPLAKKTKPAKGNQGAQWGPTGSEGTIHKVPNDGGAGGGGVDSPKTGKRGRNISIGKK